MSISCTFWMLRMLVTKNKPCHMPHASLITTWETIFTKILFGVSQEWVRSWSYASLVTDLRTFAKKLSAIRPKTLRRKRKRKRRKKERQLQSFSRYTQTQKMLKYSLSPNHGGWYLLKKCLRVEAEFLIETLKSTIIQEKKWKFFTSKQNYFWKSLEFC